MKKIDQICVIGSGVMGSGIAALAANAGIKVLLLDIKSDDDPNLITKTAITKMLTSKPAPLSHPSRADFITPGNLEDDLDKIRDCGLIIEVIIEKLEVKQDLYKKLLPFLLPTTIVASNTSTLSLKSLKAKLPEWMAKNFMILHFFNPPRYMPLLELVTDKGTSKEAKTTAHDFITHTLGKEIVECKDTPGFIANRIGCFLLELVLRKTIKYELEIEIVDQVFSKYLSFPSTGIFGLYDLIGIDVMRLISSSLLNSLPSDDSFAIMYTPLEQITQMIETKYTGRKGLGGFYRLRVEGGVKSKEVLNLESMEYSPLKNELLDYGNINHLLASNNNLSKGINEILLEFGHYICTLVPEVSANIYDIDRAMRLGYSWKYGPFELYHRVIDNGFEWINKHTKYNDAAFIKSKQYSYIKNEKFSEDNSILPRVMLEQIMKNDLCLVSELKNDALCFSITSKMNVLNEEVFKCLIETITYAEAKKKKIYIYSDFSHFSVGADLKFILQQIEEKNWARIDSFLDLGQRAMMRMKYAKVPIIAAASGLALGGGCELLLHSHHIIAHEQLSAGLVEVGVGLIPAFGGTKEMVMRGRGSPELLIRNLKNIILQNKSASADYFAKDYMVDLSINMNRKYLLQEAMDLTLKRKPAGAAEARVTIPAFDLEKSLDFTALDRHSFRIIALLQNISGKSMNEQELLELEREIFLELAQTPEVEQKIRKVLHC